MFFHQTRAQKKPREPVSSFIPLTEEEKEEAKKANIVFVALLSDHLTPTQPTGGNIVESPAPLKTTPPIGGGAKRSPCCLVLLCVTLLYFSLETSRQNVRRRPGLLLFSISPEEEVQQKKMEKVNTQRRKEQNQTEMQKVEKSYLKLFKTDWTTF